MRAWDERNSFVRKTARQIRDFDIPDKCRDGIEKAEEVAKNGCKKAKRAYSAVRNYDYGSACAKAKNRASDVLSYCVGKVRERNPIAVAICVGVSAFAVFALFFSVFYTIFSVSKKRR